MLTEDGSHAGRSFLIHVPEVPICIMYSANIEVPPPSSTITDLLTTGMDTSPFEGLIPRPSEPIGVPSLFYSPSVAQHIISTLILNVVASNEVSDMVHSFNEAF